MFEEIILATKNNGKLSEIREIFKEDSIKLISLTELNFIDEITEDADSFLGNALKKAKIIFNYYKKPVLADDSGLEVDILNNRPGVYSARYAGENVSYEDNNNKLISELESFVPPYNAKFVTCAVFIDSEIELYEFGYLYGEIILDKRGNNGFGYDPIFIPQGYNLTLAEMNLNEKNSISHRSKAFKGLKQKIKEHRS